MKIHVIDSETTGLDPEKDRVVEIAAVEMTMTTVGEWIVSGQSSSFVNPHMPIPPEATAVHHIVDADVAGAPDLGDAIEHVLGLFWRESVEYVAAHNCIFDRDMLPPLKDKQWIDTYRCAMHVWPDAPNFKNATLFYWLGFKRIEPVEAHRATYDAMMTAGVLDRLLDERPVGELLRLSTKAVVLKKVGFGMHFGKLWTEVPDSYLSWGSKQNFDPDVKFTIKSELARRRSAQ